MKMAFKPKSFSSDAGELIELANEIIDDYREQGFKLSLRQLYYQMVSKNAVPNTEQSYDRVGTIIAEARMAGLCDWDMIEDRGRECVVPPHWDTPAQIIEACAGGYRIDKWETQPGYCEVMVEKQALEGVLEPVCRRLDIPFTANKGYSSITMMYQAGRRLLGEFRGRAIRTGLCPERFEEDDRGHDFFYWMYEEGYLLPREGAETLDQGTELTPEGKKAGFAPIVLFYLGDHDPSGIDMTRDVGDRLALFSDSTPMEVRRLVLNMDQVRELRPPENPAKVTDSRAAKYIERFGRSSWELDAVSPERLAALVTNAVATVRDGTIWAKAEAREKRERATLDKIVRDLKSPKKK